MSEDGKENPPVDQNVKPPDAASETASGSDQGQSNADKGGAVPQDSAADDKQDAVSKDAKPDAADGKSNDGVVSFRGKIEIHPGVPLPHYNVERNKAYKAVAKDKMRTPLFAVVCETHLVPRLAAAKVYETIINPGMANLVMHGAVYWPPAKQERYVFLYLDNLGKPLLAPDAPQALGWSQDDVTDIIITPMINILLDFKDKDFVHGGIRATNIYDGGSSGKASKVMLGECLSAPASYMQPALYETVERATADPISRGKGTQADDLYALGVTLAVCLRTSDTLKDVSHEDIIRQKIQQGSYSAITGKDRFKGEILELLRGLLHDDPGQRWTVDEVQVWLDGRRLSPKQALIRNKATRPIMFANSKYIYAELLSMDLDTNPTEVKRIVEDDTLFQWIKRSLENEELLEVVNKAVTTSQQGGTGPGYEERLATHISCALDRMAPLRFKNMIMTGDGMGTAMAEAIVLKQDLKAFADILSQGFMLEWLSLSTNPHIDINGLFNKYEQCRRFIRSVKLGEGLERCVYLLSVECPCLSEQLSDYYVTTPYKMFKVYEHLCEKKKAPQNFMDRHTVAFLMQRSSKVIEPFLFELNATEDHKVILANLKVMAAIQKHFDGGDVPAMSRYFAEKLARVYEKYHDRNVRDKIKKAIEDISDKGDLQKMVAILDNLDLLNKDAKGFRKAVEEFAGLEREKQELEARLADKDQFGVESGREMAAIVASILAAVIILGVAFMFFSGGSMF